MKLKTGVNLLVAVLILSLSQVSLACDSFDPGGDPDTCLANCVNAGCDTANAGCSTYCDTQTFSPE